MAYKSTKTHTSPKPHTPPQVREYSKVFWERYRELNDWEKVLKNIERGEFKIQRQSDIMNAVAMKLERYKNPWQELRVGLTAISLGLRQPDLLYMHHAAVCEMGCRCCLLGPHHAQALLLHGRRMVACCSVLLAAKYRHM